MEKLGSQILDQLKDPSTLNPILAAAGASGLLGGFATAQTARRRGETAGQRRLRIIRNALLAAGAGGGAVALGSYGLHNAANALPAGDEDPVKKTLTGGAAHGIAGLATLLGLNGGSSAAKRDSAGLLQNRLLEDAVGLDPAAKAKIQSVNLRGALQDADSGPAIREHMAKNMFGGKSGNPDNVMRQELMHAGLPAYGPEAGERKTLLSFLNESKRQFKAAPKAKTVGNIIKNTPGAVMDAIPRGAAGTAGKNILARTGHELFGVGRPHIGRISPGMLRGLPNAAKAAITLAMLTKGPELIGKGISGIANIGSGDE